MDSRIALGVEYDGTNYFGFQKQNTTKQTIQGSLEESISKVADHKVKTFCSGRTDAGVHAFMQVMHFNTKAIRSSIEWTRGINSYLPKDIRVLWAKEIDESFMLGSLLPKDHIFTIFLIIRLPRRFGQISRYMYLLD